MVSHFIMPPKILIRMALTFGWELRISKAVLTCSTLAPPPTSKKLAGSPPLSLMMSMVAIASPAPLTIHPILPSRATQLRPAATALSSCGSISSEAKEFFFKSASCFCLNLALSSILILASTLYILLLGSVAQGLIQSCTASHSMNSLQRFLTCSAQFGTFPKSKSFSSCFSSSGVIPFLMSTGYTLTAEGFFLATYSIQTPPSVDATIAGPCVFLSRMKAKYICLTISTPSCTRTALTLRPSLVVWWVMRLQPIIFFVFYLTYSGVFKI